MDTVQQCTKKNFQTTSYELNNFSLFSLTIDSYNKAIKIKRNANSRPNIGTGVIYNIDYFSLFHFFLSSFLVAESAA